MGRRAGRQPSRHFGSRGKHANSKSRRSASRSFLRFEQLEVRSLLAVSIIGTPSWAEQGPGPITNGNNVLGIPNKPQAGAIDAVAVDPLNRNHVFAATVDGGIWRTSNFQAADPLWSPLTDSFPGLAMGDIKFDPLDPSGNTIWAGSGNKSNDLGDSNPVMGVLKTTDNGNHWTQLGETTFSNLNIIRIVPTTVIDTGVGPGRGGQVILVATDGGLYQSNDAGATFNLDSGANGLPTGVVTDIASDSSNNLRYYAALPAVFDNNNNVTRNGGVFRGDLATATGVITWTNVSAGINGINNTVNVLVAVHNSPGNNIVNVATLDATVVAGKVTATPFAGVSRSTNQGGNWTLVGGALPNTNPGQQGGGFRNFSFVVDPVNPNFSFVSGDRGTANNAGDIFRVNASGGGSYTSVANGGANNTAPHPDSRMMVFDSTGADRILIETNDGGVYRLTDPEGSPTWNSANGDIRPTEFFAVAYDTVNGVIFGGAQDNSTPEQNSPGNFTWTDHTGGDGEEVGVDNTSNPNHSIRYTNDQNLGNFTKETYDNTNTMVSSTSPGLVVNGTGGQTIFQVEANANPGGTAPFLPFFTPWVLNAADPTRILFGTSNFLYESTDQGSTLNALGGVTNLGGGNFKPSSPVGAVGPFVGTDPIAYGGFSGGVANTAVLWVGTGNNLRLRTSGSGLPAVVANYTGSAIVAIVMDPSDWHTAYILDRNNRVFRAVSNDAGTTVNFTNITSNLPSDPAIYRSIEFVRSGGTQVLLVGGQQVYRAINPGNAPNWTVFGQGLPNANVRDLHYIPANGGSNGDVLLAGTDGRGAWIVTNAAAALVSQVGSEVLVCGDEMFPDQNDTFRLVRDPAFPANLDVYVNGVLEQVVPLAGVQKIAVYGGGGFNTLTVDSSNGLINVPDGITFNAGDPCPQSTIQVGEGIVDPPMGEDGTGELILTQTGGPTITSDVYSPGPNPGQGTDVITDSSSNGQSIYFTELAPVLDNVPSPTAIVNGTPAANAIDYTVGPGGGIFGADSTGIVTVDNLESYEFSQKANLTINGLAGNDIINLNYPTGKPTGMTTITVNGGDGDDSITTRGGVTVSTTFNGGAGNDTIDASGVNAATATLNGNDGNDALIGSVFAGANNTFDGGTGDDTILLPGTTAADHISVTQTAAGTYASIVNGVTHNDSFSNVEEFKIAGGDGGDVILVTPGDNLASNLHFTVEGGSGFDQLAVGDAGTGDLLLYRKGATLDSGSITVGPANAAPAVVDFTGIDFVNPIPATGGRVVTFPFDVYESNNFQVNAFDLGAPTTTTVNASIDPAADATFGLPGDSDWFKVEANVTGTLDFQLFFSELATVASGRPGLPGAGNLDLSVVDAAGNVISSSTSTDNNERVRIPVVQGQSYFAHIVGATAAINGYSLTVINAAPPTPFNLELSRSIPNGEPGSPLPPAGGPDTGDLPTTAPASDTGRSQFDNVTDTNKPTIFIRLNDAILLNDLPGNGTTNAPPDHVIPIPFSATGATAGFRVAIFDGNNTSTPVGFASPVAGFPGLYSFVFTTALSDGIHHLVARVQMVDGATPQETGFGDYSASLDITVDTVPPPVMFGFGANGGTGLAPGTDTGVITEPETFTDLVTSNTNPTFQGLAEANAIIRVYDDLNNNNIVDPTDVFLGETVAIPTDGTNAFPNGQWTLHSTVDLNDPRFFPHDGLRHLLVTAEDLAGNTQVPNGTLVPVPQQFNIFIDTQGPQITGVFISDPSENPPTTGGENQNFNLFSEKIKLGDQPANAAQGPTPLTYAITLNVQDLPARVIPFLTELAFKPEVVEGMNNADGGITLIGDANGRIAFQVVAHLDTPTPANQAATGEIQLRFVDANGNPIALPDDRYTLHVSDTAIVDPAGNLLDGESNAAEPLNTPNFPTGNGVPGGDFTARFTIDSRPEQGDFAAGRVYIDANGNFINDPQNTDFTNRDLTFTLQLAPTLIGVAQMGVHDSVFVGNWASFRKGGGPEILPQGGFFAQANGFGKLAAYGFDATAGGFRWLIDTNSDGVIDPAVGDIFTVQPTGFSLIDQNGASVPFNPSGIAFAGNFDGNATNGDEIGLFDGSHFWLDTNHDFTIDAGDEVITTNLRGFPIVGDFNGDGIVDLGTWRNDVFQFNLGTQPGGVNTPVAFSGNVDFSFTYGYPGVGEIPLAADMNGDGITDVGLWVPGRAGTTSADVAETFFLQSNDFDVPGIGRQLPLPGEHMSDADLPAQVAFLTAELDHPFAPTPLGTDLYSNFLDEFATPIVGNFDPPLAYPNATMAADHTAPTSTVSALASTTNSSSFALSWSGQDNAGGSGVAGYSVYVSDNGGHYSPIATNTTATSMTFNGQNGHTYNFVSVATDNSGNVQTTPTGAQTVTTVQVRTVTSTTVAGSLGILVPGQTVSFTATVSAVGGATPTGSVTFKDGATVLGTVPLQGGAATISTAALGVGVHWITASYAGLGQVLASTGTTGATVLAAALEADPLTAGAAALYVGGTAGADTITFSPADAAGHVGATIKTGTANTA